MRAWISSGTGNPNPLLLVEVPTPHVGPNEVLINVYAAGLNRVDLLQSIGRYSLPPEISPVLGIEVAGIVEACGEHVHDLAPGDRVMGICSAGAYADYVTLPAAHALKIPNRLSFQEAAAIPEAAATIWHNIFNQAQGKAGESVLIHGGSGGIGTIGIQLCKALGLDVFATAGSKEKVNQCEHLGAQTFNYHDLDVFNTIAETSKGIDIILDVAGGQTTLKNLHLLKRGGRLQQIGYLQGSPAEINWGEILEKNITIKGSRLRFTPTLIKDRLFENIRQLVLPLLESKQIVPILSGVYSFEQAPDALKELALGQHFGKIVLSFDR